MGRIQDLINQGIITKEMGVNMKRRLKIANDINEFLTSNPPSHYTVITRRSKYQAKKY